MSEELSASSRYHVWQFSDKTDNFKFFAKNLPKNGFRVGNAGNQCRNKNQHPRHTICANFQEKKTTFRTKFVQKWIFGCRNFKNLSLDLESAPPIYHVCQFSVKTLNFWCNCPITCNILVLITFRVLQIAGWSLNDLRGGFFFFFFFFFFFDYSLKQKNVNSIT